MKWHLEENPWKRKFALFPIDDGNGNWIWLEWYWSRFEGLYYNVSFTKEKPNY